jgi:hypothetical protein
MYSVQCTVYGPFELPPVEVPLKGWSTHVRSGGEVEGEWTRTGPVSFQPIAGFQEWTPVIPWTGIWFGQHVTLDSVHNVYCKCLDFPWKISKYFLPNTIGHNRGWGTQKPSDRKFDHKIPENTEKGCIVPLCLPWRNCIGGPNGQVSSNNPTN